MEYVAIVIVAVSLGAWINSVTTTFNKNFREIAELRQQTDARVDELEDKLDKLEKRYKK